MTPLVWSNFGHNIFFLLKLNYRNIAFHESLSCSIDTTETVHFHCMEKSTKGRASCVCKSKKLKNNAGRNCHVKSNKSVGPSSQKISHALKVHRVLTLYFFLQLNYKASWITFFWQLNNKSHTTTRKITSANNSQQCSFCDTCAFWREPSWPSIWVSQNPSFRNRLDTWHIEQILTSAIYQYAWTVFVQFHWSCTPRNVCSSWKLHFCNQFMLHTNRDIITKCGSISLFQ
jgi:hypothetical protein